MRDLDRLIEQALNEDLGLVGDLTTALTIPDSTTGRAQVVAREHGVLSGVTAAGAVFHAVDPDLELEWSADPGANLSPGQEVLRITGRARSILTAERTALNLLGQLSAVATRTARFVDLVSGTGVRIADTRKTIPGMRALQKQAVLDGGGVNHRFGLHDAVLIKDNHIGLGGGLIPVLEQLGSRVGHLVRVEVEVDTLEQLDHLLAHDRARLAAGELPVVHAVLLDNMGPELVRQGVARVREHPAPVLVEVSGGVNEESVRALAESGPDLISIGALTHSVACLDLGLDLVV
ncbi:MAG TPA: carboxylating nicotinate-nucleotide diphosphorylase [Marmoricola sp.]|nr:carboxylating nicotinate-nucleotide diphosphorylase [Marmoricola sp.]HNI69980.1 carboxylating nicotinate-nucleotide diphosphorylase [Marmoricola sp.]